MLAAKLIIFALDEIDPDIISSARYDFYEHDLPNELAPDSSLSTLFLHWLLYSRTIETERRNMPVETTIAQVFLRDKATELTPDELELLASSIRSPFSLCEVVAVKPGVSIQFFDLLRRTQYTAAERTASTVLRRGEIVYCAVSYLKGAKSCVAMGPYALPPTAKLEVLDLRDWMTGETGKARVTAGTLDEFEYAIRELYLDKVRAMLAPPAVRNTDGHEMRPQTLYFDILSAGAAFHALKDLAIEQSEEELLTDALIENGKIREAEIPWLGGSERARKQLGGPVLLGRLVIKDDQLTVEVNSSERAASIRKLIEERLGEDVTFRRSDEGPQIGGPGQTGLRPADLGAGAASSAPFGDLGSSDDPDIRLFIAKQARQFWREWPDVPVPALDNATPREAAKTRRGRDLLESLLLSFEITGRRTADDPFAPPVANLRRELGMDRQTNRTKNKS
jgi:hypothetical protein